MGRRAVRGAPRKLESAAAALPCLTPHPVSSPHSVPSSSPSRLPPAELQRVQSGAPNPSDPAAVLVGPYVKKVESLRKRLDAVSYTMTRVQVRLESLQDAITRQEKSR